MSTWTANKAYKEHGAPDAVQDVMRALGDVSELAVVRSADGGIQRDDVLAAPAERRR